MASLCLRLLVSAKRVLLDTLGDHIVACGGSGGRISRHDRLRDTIFNAATAASLVAINEQRNIIPGERFNPVKLFDPSWIADRPAAFDATVTPPKRSLFSLTPDVLVPVMRVLLQCTSSKASTRASWEKTHYDSQSSHLDLFSYYKSFFFYSFPLLVLLFGCFFPSLQVLFPINGMFFDIFFDLDNFVVWKFWLHVVVIPVSFLSR